jgi:hypothetical protein
VKELYLARQQSTRQLMDYFQIGSRRTLYKILRFAGVEIPEKAATSKLAQPNATSGPNF